MQKNLFDRLSKYPKLLKNIAIIATIIIASSSLEACQKKAESPEPQPPTKTQVTKEKAPEKSSPKLKLPANADGWVVVEDKVWLPILNDLGENLQKARESYLKKDNQKAASQIEAAVNLLKKEESTATESQKAALVKSIADLEKIGTELKENQVDSVKKLDKIFLEAIRSDINSKWVQVVVEEAFPIYAEIDKHWNNASKFLSINKDAAASEIRKGTAFLELEAIRANDKQKATLLAAVKELKTTADRVENGNIKDTPTLATSFAKANLTLAEFYTDRANNAASDNNLKEAGYELKSALAHVEATRTWLKSEKDKGTTKAEQLNAVSNKLLAGKTADPQEIKSAIDYLKAQIKTLNRDLG